MKIYVTWEELSAIHYLAACCGGSDHYDHNQWVMGLEKILGLNQDQLFYIWQEVPQGPKLIALDQVTQRVEPHLPLGISLEEKRREYELQLDEIYENYGVQKARETIFEG